MQESYKIKQDKTATISEFRNQYYFLSNFYECLVSYNGITYRNAEAAFQAQKTLDNDIRKQFEAMSASEAKKQGRRISLREDWEDVKVDIMRDIVLAKFEQNPELSDKLIKTDGMCLIEGNNWGDRTWGMVGNEGMNLLGNILMETRETLICQKDDIEL